MLVFPNCMARSCECPASLCTAWPTTIKNTCGFFFQHGETNAQTPAHACMRMCSTMLTVRGVHLDAGTRQWPWQGATISRGPHDQEWTRVAKQTRALTWLEIIPRQSAAPRLGHGHHHRHQHHRHHLLLWSNPQPLLSHCVASARQTLREVPRRP